MGRWIPTTPNSAQANDDRRRRLIPRNGPTGEAATSVSPAVGHPSPALSSAGNPSSASLIPVAGAAPPLNSSANRPQPSGQSSYLPWNLEGCLKAMCKSNQSASWSKERESQ
ncbi:hypothetical protein GUJ93_ZPchr0012g19022 [Zizania palustris]|uniref:Uncharacterized protein n=1 Tax=Zizania palustris TaxID=103762 RepID=A0A8J5WUZ2_ZIZPA|nr:hypothetical protein GUJ93_ZPchr0012g19022 [Zizania palustris]